MASEVQIRNCAHQLWEKAGCPEERIRSSGTRLKSS